MYGYFQNVIDFYSGISITCKKNLVRLVEPRWNRLNSVQTHKCKLCKLYV